MPTRVFLRAAAALLIVAGIFAPPRIEAQPAPPAPLKFESASVIPSILTNGRPVSRDRGGSCPPTFALTYRQLEIGCVTLDTLIGYAFNVPRYRVAGPDWMQSLLVERLHLAARRGTREQSVDALVVTNGGLKLKEVAPETPETNAFASIAGAAGATGADVLGPFDIGHIGGLLTRASVAPAGSGPGFTHTWTNARIGTVSETMGLGELRLRAPGITCEGLAGVLVAVAMLPDVADMTQSKARYQLDLRVPLSGAAAAPVIERPRRGPPSPAAVERAQAAFHDARRKAFNKALLKLGLQLEPRTAPVDVVIVDRVERSPR
jgi:uncharacterized protein (TIGR03435 family)